MRKIAIPVPSGNGGFIGAPLTKCFAATGSSSARPGSAWSLVGSESFPKSAILAVLPIRASLTSEQRASARPALRHPRLDELDVLGRKRRQPERHSAHL